MIKTVARYHMNTMMLIAKWEREHPYRFSCVISTVLVLFILLYSFSSSMVYDKDLISTDRISFIDMDTIQLAKRVVKRQVSVDGTEISDSNSNVERSTGTSEEGNAVDISIFPGIVAPKPVTRLKKLYPRIAKEMDIESDIYIELLIAANGRVLNINIIGIKLSKPLPDELSKKIKRKFIDDARKILIGAQFTPPIVNGKNVAIKMEMPLKFRLEQQ